MKGQGVEQSEQMAISYLQKADLYGHKKALYEMGEYYRSKKLLSVAKPFYEKACEKYQDSEAAKRLREIIPAYYSKGPQLVRPYAPHDEL